MVENDQMLHGTVVVQYRTWAWVDNRLLIRLLAVRACTSSNRGPLTVPGQRSSQVKSTVKPSDAAGLISQPSPSMIDDRVGQRRLERLCRRQ